jgi:uncharacterized protein
VTGGPWPWWLGAAGLAGVTVGSCLVGHRPFGVSGIVGRLVDWRRELPAERARAAMASADEASLEAALAAATEEAFAGMAPVLEEAPPATLPPPRGADLPDGRAAAAPAARPTLAAHAVFLIAIVAGAALVSALRGGVEPTLALPEAYARLVAPGGLGYLALGAGGLLVGVGTTISGGCSTGHGLTGCAQLHPAGLVATATFFGVAVAVSLLLAGSLG